MKLHLFWLDKNWIQRGYAKNFNLLVDFEHKTFKVYENPFLNYTSRDDIEVKKKSDIDDYIKYLKQNNFEESED